MAMVILPPSQAPDSFLAKAAGHVEEVLSGQDAGIWVRPSLQSGRKRLQPDLVIGGPEYAPAVVVVLPWGRDGQPVSAAGKDFVRVGRGDTAEVHRRPWESLRRAGDLLEQHLKRVPQGSRCTPRLMLWLPYLSAEAIREAFPQESQACDAVWGKEQSKAETLARDLKGGEGLPLELLKAAIEPQLHFFDLREEPSASPQATSPLPQEWGYFLDRKQERMACELASPRTLVYGPAGSGKTVFLMARAQYWLQREPEARILLTCYNASLAAHMRRSLILKGMDPDGESLTVLHYHDLCREILGLGVEFHEQTPEFYASLEPRVLKHLSSTEESPEFDLILVDEGQDFTRRMFEVLIRLSRSGGEVTVVADPAQDIYLRWEESNLEPLGNYEVERLVDCYRNTAPIFGLARSVIPKEAQKALGLNRLELTRPEDLGRDGPPPRFEELHSLEGWADLIQEQADLLLGRGQSLSQLAVLYTDRHAIPEFSRRLRASSWSDASRAHLYDIEAGEDSPASPTLRVGSLKPAPGTPGGASVHFVEALLAELDRRGIPAEWITKDFETKAAFDIQKPRLVISTIHSAKGMDFDTVMLMGTETLSVENDPKASSLLFAGMTRAREMLILPYFRPLGWIPELQRLAQEAT